MRFLERAGVRYYLLASAPAPDARPLLALPELAPLHLWERPAPAPRDTLVPAHALEPDLPRQVQRLFDPDFDPDRTLLLEAPPPPPAGAPGPPAPAPLARILEETPTHVLLQASVPHPSAFLLLRDSFDPNWVVEVDGQAAPLVRADARWRAVHLAPGEHQVRFAYRSRPLRLGALLSCLTALVLLSACAWPKRVPG